ncbi:hypothetical protein [Paractinoplanes lichenicola]|uniref:PhnB-like domain-containing protein n=1 Tax=Paractinoplanes lichenicola TaxID=2802976 RepID=A0ABS1W354_9ACTN|nr:hypothetical protein [Actinoplanes lichenicola]MBL7261171.1 hypothetical protein [Actinoplanes lichenicola]
MAISRPAAKASRALVTARLYCVRRRGHNLASTVGTDAEELTGYWKALSEGATVIEELATSAWSPLYGMLKDRFGVTWVLDLAVAY